MHPDPPTAEERKVIRWFFGIAFGLAIVLITWGWLSRRQECISGCEAKGFQTGRLIVNAEGRFIGGTRCVCENDAPSPVKTETP
jgi:hypothetical protein